MSRIKGRYVAQVVLEWDVPREHDMNSLEEIRHIICDGDLTNEIKDRLSSAVERCSVTVDQMYADVYEVDDEGGQDEAEQ